MARSGPLGGGQRGQGRTGGPRFGAWTANLAPKGHRPSTRYPTKRATGPQFKTQYISDFSHESEA